jgi:predicted amidohydrolase YtcJ
MLEASDHHCAWVNTEALRRAAITRDSPDPPAGRIPRRPDGEPLGTLVEWTAMDLVRRYVPQPGRVEKSAGVVAAAALLASAGVTWAQEAALHPDDLEAYLVAEREGGLPLRVNVALRAEPDRWRDQVGEFVAARERCSSSSAVSARTVKLFADGVVEAGTASMLEPYADQQHSCGLPVWEPAELARAVTAFDAVGFQAHIHAIGDAAVRAALDAVEAATRVNGPRDRRTVLAHVHVVDPADVPRFATLGVVANVEPLWACLEPGMVGLVLPRLGPQRSELQYPFASLVAAGARLSTGTDWPVSSYVPLECLAVAVTRQVPGDAQSPTLTAHERLDPEVALAAGSAGVAYQAFEETSWGVIAPGMRADIVALDADPVTTDAGRWSAIGVTGTWLAGRRTYGSTG